MDAAVQKLHTFFTTQCGIDPKEFEEKEKQLVDDVYNSVLEEPLSHYGVYGIVFSLCKWPPIINKIVTGRLMIEMMPEDLCLEFLLILAGYLIAKFPGTYRYDDTRRCIELISSE